MLFIDNGNSNDPTQNLALEEYSLTAFDPDETYLLFYINNPSIIIGKNQNTFEEVNLEYVNQHGIQVVRRLSGGGAVFHDTGNLNFSFITKNDADAFRNFQRFTQPVVAALKALGVDAELSGRNDIQVGDKKISGNAQFATKGRMFSHGTLMFDVDLEMVTKALHVSAEKIESKGIKSVRSRVANIREFMDKEMDIMEFRSLLLRYLFDGQKVPLQPVTDEDWANVTNLANKRYRNWDWNFGKSPEFNVERKKRFPIGTIDIKMNVRDGIIEECKIYGDFFGQGDLENVERQITGRRYDMEELRQAMSSVDLKHYFGNIAVDEFLTLF